LNILFIAKRALRFGRPSGSFASRNLTHAATVDGRSPNVDDRVNRRKFVTAESGFMPQTPLFAPPQK